MRKLIILILACLPAFAAGNLCLGPTGSTSATWTGATWTNCGGTIPGDGDFAVWRSTGTLTLNADIGTVGGGGIKTIRVENGTLAIDTSAPRTITFASTGTDPVGSGAAANPGADATMHGLFLSRGTFNLIATQANPLTITTANGTSPTYIHRNRGDFVGCTTFTANVCNGSANFTESLLTMQWVDVYRPGVNLDKFYGVYVSSGAITTVSIQNCRFTGAYYPIYLSVTAGSTVAFDHNDFVGTQGNGSIISTTMLTGAITDNTETAAAIDGYLYRPTYTPQAMTMARNAVSGDVANRGVVSGGAAGTTGGNVWADNLCISAKRAPGSIACITPVVPSGDLTGKISGTVSIGLNQGIATSATSGAIEVTGNWCSQYWDAWNGQGCVITYGTNSAINAHHNIWGQEDVDGSGTRGLIAILAYTTTGSTNSVLVDHNTITSLNQASTTTITLGLGEGGSLADGGVINSSARSNIVVGGAKQITDGNTHNTWSNLYASAGVHHNATYGGSTAYGTTLSAGFDDGTHVHPDARYGDLAVNPQLLAPSRRPWTWAAFMGGTGTTAYLFAELAKRSGWGGAYSIAISANPIQDMRLWLYQGSTPMNPALKGAAHDGADIGATAMTMWGSPAGIGSGGAAF